MVKLIVNFSGEVVVEYPKVEGPEVFVVVVLAVDVVVVVTNNIIAFAREIVVVSKLAKIMRKNRINVNKFSSLLAKVGEEKIFVDIFSIIKKFKIKYC